MSKVNIDSTILNELGVATWSLNANYQRPEFSLAQTSEKNDHVSNPEELLLEAHILPASLIDVDSMSGEESVDASSLMRLVLIGKGLTHIWQNEDTIEWQLLKNILKAIQIQQEEVLVFDSEMVHTDDAIFMTVEEVIESGVEQVFSFDAESVLNEELSEGVVVEILPPFEQMLSQALAKKSCYYRLVHYVH